MYSEYIRREILIYMKTHELETGICDVLNIKALYEKLDIYII